MINTQIETKNSGVTTPPMWRDPLLWFCLAVGLGYGGVRNFLPATFPIFQRELHASLGQMGQTQFYFYLSSLAFGFLGGPILVILGLKRAAVTALTLAAISLLLVGGARSFNLVIFTAPLFGLTICALVVIVSSAISGHFHARRQSVFLLTGLSDASGSMLGPAMLGWWLVHSQHWNLTWRSGYFIAAGLIGFLAACAIMLPKHSLQGDKPATAVRWTGIHNMRDVLRKPAFYTAVVLAFFHGLAQSGMISFIGQLYVHRLHIDAAHAAYMLSAESVGVLGGRALFSWIVSVWKIPELMVVAICAGIETMSFLATILAPNYVSGFVLFVTAGFFISAVGPSLNSYLGGRLADRVATAFALFAGLSNVGAAIGPYVIGIVGTNFGLERGILFAPFCSGLLSTLGLIRYLLERPSRNAVRL